MEEKNKELKRQLTEERTKYEITEKKAIESQQLEEKRHNEDIMALERSIQQLQVPVLYGNEATVNLTSLISSLLTS